MDTDRFRTLVDEPGPFATVYYDDSHNTADATAVSELTVRAVLEALNFQGADDALKNAVEDALTASPPPAGSSGRAVIVGHNGVMLDEQLVRPAVKTEVRLSALPYLVPLVEHGFEQVPYVVAVVDHEGADVSVHRPDAHTTHTSVDGGGYPVHKASGAENSGYGDPQPRAEEAAKKNLRAAAGRIDSLAEEAAVVFLAGDAQARAQLREHLTDRVLELSADIDGVTRSAKNEPDQLRSQIDEEFARRRLAELDDAVARFRQEDGTGRAAQGVQSVTRALRSGNVDTLIVGDLQGRTVATAKGLLAPDADTLSEYGAEEALVQPADEAMLVAAVRIGAAIVRTDERFDPDDGVAAVLRYDEFSSAPPNGV
ncbi:hypothetical protein [Rhodococcus sovatensis]|uniref:Peptide chain release factor 1 (ERF1) n=1 Tax=Rhodococcus sovatensis TaxID=1805840 RepID=A0ABZ2PKN1_9NOCA